MNPLHRLVSRSGDRRGVTVPILLAAALAAFALPLGGCSSAQTAEVESAVAVVMQDAKSPAGQKLLADVTSTALNIGLDYASGNDSGIVLAGIQGAASAARDYEGLPVAPSAALIGQAAAAGAGVTKVAATLAPTVETLITNTQKSAKQQGVKLSADDITEALARGFDAVAPAKGA